MEEVSLEDKIKRYEQFKRWDLGIGIGCSIQGAIVPPYLLYFGVENFSDKPYLAALGLTMGLVIGVFDVLGAKKYFKSYRLNKEKLDEIKGS